MYVTHKNIHLHTSIFTFTVMLVSLKIVSNRAVTIITTFYIDTVMGTVAIIFKTFVNIYDNKHQNVTY